MVDAFQMAKICREKAQNSLKPWIIRHNKPDLWQGTSIPRRHRVTGAGIDGGTANQGLAIPPDQLLPFFLAARSAINPRIDLLRTAFLANPSSFSPTASGGDHRGAWPLEARRFLQTFLPLQNPPNYQLVAGELVRLCSFFRARSAVENYVKAHYAHLAPSPTRKPRVYRRFRRTHIGELWQHDSSLHQWWPASSKQTLILTVDDASGLNIAGRFVGSDTTWNHFEHFREAFERHGRPRSSTPTA